MAADLLTFLTSPADNEADDAFLGRLDSVAYPPSHVLGKVFNSLGAEVDKLQSAVANDNVQNFELLNRPKPSQPCRERGLNWLQATAELMLDYVHRESSAWLA